jgi:penicillin-binding protein 1B
MALGAYDATPIDMAGAYTVFANQGVRTAPLLVRSLRNAQGDVLQDMHSDSRPVLDPRVAYVMTSMMEGVVNYGTGYEVRRRGFMAPAAGKTGTSHDAWFGGYTSNLLCIVWVGYDDYSDLRLSGSQTAAPIWAEFMKRAIRFPEYRDVHEFVPPPGVVDVRIDKVTNRLSTPACPQAVTVAFIAGTEPRDTCEQQPGQNRNFFQKILGIGTSPPALPPPAPPAVIKRTSPGAPPSQNVQVQAPPQPPAQEEKKKRGFFGRIFGAIKGDDNRSTDPGPAKH